MSKTIKGILLAGLIGLTVNVAALDLKPNAPDRYVVKKGDTLWAISERFTDDPWQWPEIWYINSQIENPHLIFPGDEIGLIQIDGKRRVTVVRRGQDSRTVKLQPTARIEPIESAIPTIPQDAIRGFLRNHRLVTEEQLEDAPRILAGADGRLLMGAGNKVYARGEFKDGGDTAYGIYRRSKVYRDPVTREFLGLEAVEIGLARKLALEGDIMTLELERTNQQVSEGDVLLPTDKYEIIANYYPKAPSKPVKGQILAVSGGVMNVGQYDVVIINRGERDGLEQGSVLLVNKVGKVVYDRYAGEKVRLPEERAGTLMVFKAFDKLSYGLIMRSTLPLQVGDTVENPED